MTNLDLYEYKILWTESTLLGEEFKNLIWTYPRMRQSNFQKNNKECILMLGSNNQCGGNVTGNQINFYQNVTKYNSNPYCVWTIQRNTSFFLRFSWFKLGGWDGSCPCDYLMVGHGKKLCGELKPFYMPLTFTGEINVFFYSCGVYQFATYPRSV